MPRELKMYVTAAEDLYIAPGYDDLLGRVGETDPTIVSIDVTAWAQGDVLYSVAIRRPDNVAWDLVAGVAGNVIICLVPSEALEVAGTAALEISATDGDMSIKTAQRNLRVKDSIAVGSTPLPSASAWLDLLTAAAAELVTKITAAQGSVSTMESLAEQTATDALATAADVLLTAGYKDAAAQSAQAAQGHAAAAEAAKAVAVTKAGDAEASTAAALQHKQDAQGYRDEATQAKTDALAARDTTQTLRDAVAEDKLAVAADREAAASSAVAANNAAASVPTILDGLKGQPSGICPLDQYGYIPYVLIPGYLNRPRFGARWDKVTYQMTRLGDAAGMTAVPSTPDTAGQDDFAAISLWDNYGVNVLNNEIVAQEGDPGFELDGSNGDVHVAFAGGHYKVIESDTYREVWVSEYPADDLIPSPAHNRPNGWHPTIYPARYPAYWDGAKLLSKSGVRPTHSMSRITSRQRAVAKGAGWCLYDVSARTWIDMLREIKFASMNAQTTIGGGLQSLPYSNDDKCTVAQTSANSIILANARAARFGVGMVVGIGTAYGSGSVALDRTITEIEAYDASNMRITLDGAAFTAAVNNVLWCQCQPNGYCDTVKGFDGNGANLWGLTHKQVLCLGMEKPWAGGWEWEDGLTLNNGVPYVASDYTQFNDDPTTAIWQQLSYSIAQTAGYIAALGYDPAHPGIWLPTAVGGAGNSTNPVGDYHYITVTGVRASRVGGDPYNGVNAGPRYRNLNNAPSISYWSILARLLWIPA